MNSLKMSNRTLVTGKNMQEAIEPQDPGLMVEKHSLSNKRVSSLEQKMAAAGPIIHCVIATRVFRSVYIVYN